MIEKIKHQSGAMFEITCNHPLTESEKKEISCFSETIYHNDLTCKLWAFDTKLSSGAWLENITFTNDLKTATALILN